jgi:hypothetical protein
MSLTNDEYEKRKLFCKEIEQLSRPELEELYRILRKENGEFSENSNGIFFDVSSLPASVFDALWKFVEFCKSNAKDLEERTKMITEMAVKSD